MTCAGILWRRLNEPVEATRMWGVVERALVVGSDRKGSPERELRLACQKRKPSCRSAAIVMEGRHAVLRHARELRRGNDSCSTRHTCAVRFRLRHSERFRE